MTLFPLFQGFTASTLCPEVPRPEYGNPNLMVAMGLSSIGMLWTAFVVGKTGSAKKNSALP